MSLPRCQIWMDTSITMFVPSPLLWLKMTSVSFILTKCTPWVLVIIDPCPCDFTKAFECLSSFVLPSRGCQSWPHTEACFCCKFDLIWVIIDWLTKSAHFIPVNTKYIIIEVRNYLLQGYKQSYTTQFSDLENFYRFSLTISYIWNSITSSILGDSLCMSIRS
jgi:hypothetical protein